MYVRYLCRNRKLLLFLCVIFLSLFPSVSDLYLHNIFVCVCVVGGDVGGEGEVEVAQRAGRGLALALPALAVETEPT